MCAAEPHPQIVPSELYPYRLTQNGDLRRGTNYGVWNVTRLNVADPSKPLLTPTLAHDMHIPPGQDHWRRVIFGADNTAYLLMGPEDYDLVVAKQTAGTGHLELTDTGDPAWRCDLLLKTHGPRHVGNDRNSERQPHLRHARKRKPRQLPPARRPPLVSEGRRW